jgi:predicted ATPase
LHIVAEVCAWRGELERAREAAREEFEICANYGIRGAVGGAAENGIATLGWVLVLRGEFAQGLAELRRAIDEIGRRGQKLLVPLYLGRLALGYLGAGDTPAASDGIPQAIRLASETGERIWDPELRRIEGAIAVKQGRADDAEHAFRAAIRIAQAQEAKSGELRAATSLSRLLADRGRRQEAHALLAPVYGWFSEGFDTADLKEAKNLIDELSI